MGTPPCFFPPFLLSPFSVSETQLLQLQFGVCACLHCACVHLSGFVQAIASTFVHGFKNNLAQLFSLRS